MLCLSQGIHNIIYMLHCGLLSSLSNSLYVVLKIGNVLKLEKVLKFIFEKKGCTDLKTVKLQMGCQACWGYWQSMMQSMTPMLMIYTSMRCKSRSYLLFWLINHTHFQVDRLVHGTIRYFSKKFDSVSAHPCPSIYRN